MMNINLSQRDIMCSFPAIRDMAVNIYHEYNKKEFNPNCFADIAEAGLLSFTDYGAISSSKICKWMLDEVIPDQFNRLHYSEQFGQPPVTLFRCDHFIIDAYFWMNSDTDIHDHSFTGAFKVVRGETLHKHYDFQQKISYNNDLILGTLNLLKTELLNSPNQVVKILPGKALIHSTMHLQKPTVTLCVRTLTFPMARQYGYNSIGIALSGGIVDRINRSYQLALTLYHDNKEQFQKLIRKLCKKSNPLDLYHLVVSFYNYTEDVAALNFILDEVNQEYPELASYLNRISK